jgi:hypothetical protein
MTDAEYEALYIHFFEMDTDDLVRVNHDFLTISEIATLFDVLEDRRDEIDSMLAALQDELDTNVKKRTIRVPAEIISQLAKWDAARTSFLDS